MAENDYDNLQEKTLREILSLEREITNEYGSRRSAVQELQEEIKGIEESHKRRISLGTQLNRLENKALEYQAKADATSGKRNQKEKERYELLAKQNLQAAEATAKAYERVKLDDESNKEAAKKLKLLEEANKRREAEIESAKKFLVQITGAKKVLDAFAVSNIVDGLFGANTQAVTLSKQFGMSMTAARGVREEFEEFSRSSTRYDAERLTKAQQSLGAAIGQNVMYSNEMAADFVELTEYMGVSEQSAGRLAQTAASLGTSSEEFRSGIANSLAPLNKSLGINLNLKDAYEEIGKLSTTTLINLGRNPQKLLEAVATAKRFGIELEQLKNTSNSLLDFESSIANELEAELLTGRTLNLERARSAALRGDEVTLMQEMAKQVGTINDFEKMNVIQRESLAQAFGMNADQMGTMLMRQEAMSKLSGEAKEASDEQLRAAKELMNMKDSEFKTLQAATEEIQKRETAQRSFEDSMRKLKTLITDVLSKLEPVLSGIASLVKSMAESPMAKWLVGAGIGLGAISGIMKAASVLNGGAMRGMFPMTPLFVKNVGVAGAAGGAGGMDIKSMGENLLGKFYQKGTPASGGLKWNEYQKAMAGKGLSTAEISEGYQAQKMGTLAKKGGLTKMGKGVGLGAVAGLAGMGLSYLGDQYEEGSTANVGLGVAGGALSGAGTGAMMGAMLGPAGMAAGAALGAAVGGLTAYLDKKDKQEEKEKETGSEKYDKMIKLLEEQAKKDTKVFMDANQVGISMALGNPRLN